MTTTFNLPRWAAYLLAVVCTAVALGAAWVQFDLFTLAIHLTETRPELRTTMNCMTLLFVGGELLAVFIAGLMPEPGWRRRLRLLATAAVALEVVMIFGAQVTMARSADAVADAQQGRIEQLRASIASQRRAVDVLTDSARRQSESIHAHTRADGAQSLRRVAAMEAQTLALSRELADLEAKQVATATEVFGERGMIATKVASAVLVSAFCLTFSGAAGALIGTAQAQPLAHSAGTVTPSTSAAPAPTPAPAYSTPVAQRWAAGVTLAAIPAAAFAAPSVTVTAPVTADTETPRAATVPTATTPTAMEQAVTPEAATPPAVTTATVMQEDTATNPTVVELAATPKPARERTVTASAATTRVRYERIRAGIVTGTIKPSVRAVQSAEGGGTAEVRACLQQLERDGVLVRSGQGWALLQPPVDANQMDLIGSAA